MIDAADLETRLRSGDFGIMTAAYLHRAVRETSTAVLNGRDRLVEAAVADVAALPGAALTLGFCADDLASFRIDHGATSWCGHRWLEREGELVVRETLIEDGTLRAATLGAGYMAVARTPIHAPLGELRPGRGQFAAGETAIVPADWPSAARAIADVMHMVWNGRAIDRLAALWQPDVVWSGPDGNSGDRAALAHWLAVVVTAFPDATLMFERAIVGQDVVALLWRLHGHHHGPGFGAPTSRRIRVIGSSVLHLAGGRIVADETLIDTQALAQQLATPPIAWRTAASESAAERPDDGDNG